MIKRLILPLILLLPFYYSLAQSSENLGAVVQKKFYSQLPQLKIPKGAHLTNIELEYYNGQKLITADFEDKRILISKGNLKDISFSATSLAAQWHLEKLTNSLERKHDEHVNLNKLRQELYEDADDYLRYIQEANLLFRDSYVEAYLSRIIRKIYPKSFTEEGRKNNVIYVVKNSQPEIQSLANGTLLISTGLLSSMGSEQELIALLTVEMVHYQLDHQVYTVAEQIKLNRRAEILSRTASVLTGIGTGIVAARNDIPNTGLLTLATYYLSQEISERMSERLGLKYSRELVLEADQTVLRLLPQLDIDQQSLSSALHRIEESALTMGYYRQLHGQDRSPSLSTRINKIGSGSLANDRNYLQGMSTILSLHARTLVAEKQFEAALNIIDLKIDKDLANEGDYLSGAICIYNIFKEKQELIIAEKYLRIAETKGSAITPTVYKYAGLVQDELGNQKLKTEYLSKYLKELKKLQSAPQNLGLPKNQEFLLHEINWAKSILQNVVG